jgi:hypothetical protein
VEEETERIGKGKKEEEEEKQTTTQHYSHNIRTCRVRNGFTHPPLPAWLYSEKHDIEVSEQKRVQHHYRCIPYVTVAGVAWLSSSGVTVLRART